MKVKTKGHSSAIKGKDGVGTEQINGSENQSQTVRCSHTYPSTPTPDSLKALYLITWEIQRR
eukprot:scaffold275357_cov30-Tisochrysis_lutea.AAC.1